MGFSASSYPVFAAELRGRACFQLGEQDTLEKAKKHAYLEALRQMVSNYATYVFSSTETKDLVLQNDQLQAIAGGVLRKLECSYPPIAQFNICAECVAEAEDVEMKKFLDARLRDLGISDKVSDPQVVVSRRYGGISVTTNAPGNLAVDGRVESIKPGEEVTFENLPIGHHQVTLDVEGRKQSKDVFVSEKDVAPVRFRDAVAALTQSDNEILGLEKLKAALDYLQQNFGRLQDIEEQLKKRILGRRVLIKGYLVSVGRQNESIEKTRWYAPPAEGLKLMPGLPLLLYANNQLNAGVHSEMTFITSDITFEYSKIFHEGFAQTYPDLYSEIVNALPISQLPIRSSGEEGTLFHVDRSSFADHLKYARSYDTPLLAVIGTVHQLKLEPSYSPEGEMFLRNELALKQLVLKDCRIIAINNLDPNEVVAKIFERDQSKEKSLDTIFDN
jgi:hypothetical protein